MVPRCSLLSTINALALAVLLLSTATGGRGPARPCPCSDPPLETPSVSSIARTCIISGILSRHVSSLVGNPHILSPDVIPAQANCTLLLRVVGPAASSTTHASATPVFTPSNLCPGVCFPVPELSIPSEWFTSLGNLTTITPAALYRSTGGKDAHVLCSLEAKQLLNLAGSGAANPGQSLISLSRLLSALSWRRVMECREQKVWRHGYARHLEEASNVHTSRGSGGVTRRRVESVVIWIGGADSGTLITAQSAMLLGQATRGHGAVIGWAATEQMYGCRGLGPYSSASTAAHADHIDSTTCAAGMRGNARYKYLPNSAVNFMPKGWACAQRRPLRALAHVLALFDPTFLVLVDDDTLVNYPLLSKRYGHFIRGNMTSQSVVMGELLGKLGPEGHLSKGGIFAGGSGYVLGRRLLRALHAKELTFYGGLGLGYIGDVGGRERYLVNFGDAFRSHEQVRYLSLLGEAFEGAKEGCGDDASASSGGEFSPGVGYEGGGKCIISLNPTMRGQGHLRSLDHMLMAEHGLNLSTSTAEQHAAVIKKRPQFAYANKSFLNPRLDLTVPLGIRLVDFCVHLMAGENTCHHSDHSIGRCLVYGAHASPINVVCHSTKDIHTAQYPTDQGAYPAVPLEKGAKNVMLGMCFMTPACDLALHTTCHRYLPGDGGMSASAVASLHANSNNADAKNASARLAELVAGVDQMRVSSISGSAGGGTEGEEGAAALARFLGGTPKKVSNKAGHYKVYSSVWDGVMADSFG